ncbi:MAG: alkaline phosphatase family protein [Desulfurococcales archaeon]|nr:alkaline phosphatase family protein [Desulfurococcales archaeon]
MTRVAVIGLDGLDPQLARYMPSVASITNTKLDSIIPSTMSSWPTIMTGVNPGKHGLYGFFKIYKKGVEWGWSLSNALDLEYPRIHEMLALSPLKLGKRFAVINPIPDYPFIPVKPERGFLATIDFLSLKEKANDWKFFRKIYDIEEFKKLVQEREAATSPRQLLKSEFKVIEQHRAALEELLSSDFDLVWLNMHLPDRFLHYYKKALWKDTQALELLLSRLDDVVKLGLKHASNVVVVSDHGFKHLKGVVGINALLYREGFAVKAPDDSRVFVVGDEPKKESIVVGRSLARLVYKMLSGRGLRLARKMYIVASMVSKMLTGKEIAVRIPTDVDSIASKAFAPATTNKTVPIYTVLLNDPSIGPRVAELLRNVGLESHYAKDVLWGPHVPDYIVLAYSGKYMSTPGTIYGEVLVRRDEADHQRYGVAAFRLEDASWTPPPSVPGYSVAPVILCLLGAPLDKYMDGYGYALDACENGARETVDYRARWSIYKRLHTGFKASR